MDGSEMEALSEAIRGAYGPPDLATAIRFQMNASIYDGAPLNSDYPFLVFNLIQWAVHRGWEAELIQAVTKGRPDNPKLREFVGKYGKKYGLEVSVQVQKAGVADATAPTSAADTSGKLEEIIVDHLKFLNFEKWMGQMTLVGARICLIEIDGKPKGTGFLVGSDAVLTNYHVMKSVIEPPNTPADQVKCVFDYKTLPDGSSDRTPIALADDWNIDSSPFTEAESEGTPDKAAPKEDQLDYALIRLAQKIGNKPWSSKLGQNVPKRGWIRVPVALKPDDEPLIKSPMGVLIAQHPAGLPLQLAIDTHAVKKEKPLGLNDNRTRVRYATNTLPGSSGSPVFDMDWRLIALHHYGDKAYAHPAYNQGVPIEAIRKLLESRDKADALGGEPK
jgi:hypothetical protein